MSILPPLPQSLASTPASAPSPSPSPRRKRSDSGLAAEAAGRAAESLIATRLISEGWRIIGQRVRTIAGEIDLIASRDGLLLLAEVKTRASLDQASLALLPRQRQRLINAATWLLAEHPDWGASGVRFDVFLVDRANRVKQIEDAIREDMM